MSKTTIDGLVMRTAPRHSTQHKAGVRAPQSGNNMPIMSKKAMAAARNDFAQKNTDDWADLLDDMASEAAMDNLTNDNLLALWTAQDGDTAEKITQQTASKKSFPQQKKTRVRNSATRENMGARSEMLQGEAHTKNNLLQQEAHAGSEVPRRGARLNSGKPKRKKHLGAIIALVIAVILIGGGVAIYIWGDSLIAKLTGGQSGLMSTLSAMVSDEVPFLTDENGRTNVLIFGTEGYNMSGETASGTHDGAQLTDSIMVASFNQDTKDVALVSLPRDLKVSRACSAGKINEVFWCHNMSGDDDAAGAKALEQQIEEILGIDIQYYAHVNWASLIDIIDTLGGITVTLDEDINDYSYTGAVAKAGVPITVNGEQALGLARARHGTTGGDFTRGNTQQKIVAAIAEKLVNNGVSVMEALSLFNILGDNLRSNFSTENIKAAVRMVSGFNVANIRQVPLIDYDENTFYVTTATINEISYVVPAAGATDYSEIQQYIARMFSNDPVVREEPKVAVYNATEAPGLASTEAEELKTAGYQVVDVGDAEPGSCNQQACLYILNEKLTASQAALEQRYQVEALTATEMPAELWAGTADFVIILGQG